MCYPHTNLPEDQIRARVRRLSTDERAPCSRVRGERANRRHKPGRAFERTDYRFDVLCDYGAFRDLQRHRMLTIEWQPLSPPHGYDVPKPSAEAGLADRSRAPWRVSAALYDALARPLPRAGALRGVPRVPRPVRRPDERPRGDAHARAADVAPGASRVPAVCQEMHRLIADEAGHRASRRRCVTSITRPTSSSVWPPRTRRRAAPRRSAALVDRAKKSPRPAEQHRRDGAGHCRRRDQRARLLTTARSRAYYFVTPVP